MVDPLPNFVPVMLSGLTWKEAHAALMRVDCAIRRAHWCSPVMILHEGALTIDSDGDLYPYSPFGPDGRARDWSMVPRVNDDGDEVTPTLRTQESGHG